MLGEPGSTPGLGPGAPGPESEPGPGKPEPWARARAQVRGALALGGQAARSLDERTIAEWRKIRTEEGKFDGEPKPKSEKLVAANWASCMAVWLRGWPRRPATQPANQAACSAGGV